MNSFVARPLSRLGWCQGRRICSASALRACSTMEQMRKRRSSLFEKERIRQQNLIGLLEKIEVKVHPPKPIDGKPEEAVVILAMNKDVSTPFDCAMHLSRVISDRAALALVNGVAWDMRRPLPSDCDLKFLFYTDEDPSIVNKKDFRMLSYVPPVELRKQDLPIERLDVDVSVAKEIFQDNRFKSEQVQSIANTMKKGGKKIPLYRMGDHVDISRGPMISSTAQLGFYNVTAV
ncbi:TGS domain protein [Trichuris suis]|nr:TGS domain protein [Trichuris suis]